MISLKYNSSLCYHAPICMKQWMCAYYREEILGKMQLIDMIILWVDKINWPESFRIIHFITTYWCLVVLFNFLSLGLSIAFWSCCLEPRVYCYWPSRIWLNISFSTEWLPCDLSPWGVNIQAVFFRKAMISQWVEHQTGAEFQVWSHGLLCLFCKLINILKAIH